MIPCCNCFPLDKHDGRLQYVIPTQTLAEDAAIGNVKSANYHVASDAVTNDSGNVSSSSTRSSANYDERFKEKERLQSMVKDFATNVVLGQKCDVINKQRDDEFTIVQAQYILSRTLSEFTIEAADSDPVTVPMLQIRDIVKNVETTDLAKCGKAPSISKQLGSHFVGLVFDNEFGERKCYGLLLQTENERDKFFTCMKILRWAVTSKQRR